MCEFKEAIKKHRDGAILDLFVTPRSESATFPAGYNKWRKRIEIKVVSPAKENKANKEVLKTVAAFFNKTDKKILVVSGDKSREKTILIKDVSVDEVIDRFRKSLNGL